MVDLFQNEPKSSQPSYSAKDIEVLEGLEPVRRRPGMYIGGTDEAALHHLVAEVLDNAMDEAVAGHASRIEIELHEDGSVTVADNGRGIPIDPHPKFKDKSALEVILTTLHSGGKFSGKAYQTSGGLHGVGLSVVNALSDRFIVTVARDRKCFVQTYERGAPTSKLTDKGVTQNRRGTTITFHPDAEIFGETERFKANRLFRMARSKAYLFKGVEIRWRCHAKHLRGDSDGKNNTPESETLHFPGGLADYLSAVTGARTMLTPLAFTGSIESREGGTPGKVEWAITWPRDEDGFMSSYCNTIPTAQGGSHETGLRTALARGLKSYGEMTNAKKATQITAEDVAGGACVLLSVFIHDPQFQGQTKEKLSSTSATRLVEGTIKDHFDHWLTSDPIAANDLLERVLERTEERRRRRAAKDLARKTPTRKLRLPGKLTDCSQSTADGTELFIVEGDSAGGSAKQARERKNQAILPLRGKILNVASAPANKIAANQELANLMQALGCGTRADYNEDSLRYERIVIMTDADVDGAHIASLLMTFFYQEMPGLIENGHLYLAMPPLYRLNQGATTLYARDDAHKDELIESGFKGRGKIEISRFKGLGEMPPAQLRDTTMNPKKRTLLQVRIPDHADPNNVPDIRATASLVDALMGKKPEKRFDYIQENAKFATDLDV